MGEKGNKIGSEGRVLFLVGVSLGPTGSRDGTPYNDRLGMFCTCSFVALMPSAF